MFDEPDIFQTVFEIPLLIFHILIEQLSYHAVNPLHISLGNIVILSKKVQYLALCLSRKIQGNLLELKFYTSLGYY